MADLIRLPIVLAKTGRTRSPFYSDLSRGLFTRPVKTGGARAVAWPLHECEAIIAARIAGHTDAQVMALVEKLHQARKVAA